MWPVRDRDLTNAVPEILDYYYVNSNISMGEIAQRSLLDLNHIIFVHDKLVHNT